MPVSGINIVVYIHVYHYSECIFGHKDRYYSWSFKTPGQNGDEMVENRFKCISVNENWLVSILKGGGGGGGGVYTKNTAFLAYPMHNCAPCWLFTMVYAYVPHFNLWQGHKHPCSFQLRIALNLKSTRHYVGIDLVPHVKSRTSAQHNCKIKEVFLADCWLFRCIVLNVDDRCIRW